MTNGKDRQNEQLESLLRKVRMPEPSSELKKRVVSEATSIWKQTSKELSWRIPFVRLAASAAAAVFVIWLANFSSDHSVARWQASGSSAMRQQPSEVVALLEMPYGPFVRYLALVSRELSASDASGLRDYIETVRQLLDEAQQNRVSNPPTLFEGQSRLLPDRFNLNSYS